ncbi:hypothetical protein BUALT_Bualt13G0059100 [Buddleja alternifolia]|uniref:Uncharacterized protein n=1 Tax=Buddleja alternifolia TaxID=168488 RepID=A0AAV6WM52_9LAMI|nr:hypothetical protein BUALT_Bualt13G0059100 [Buddleja alternifolia]
MSKLQSDALREAITVITADSKEKKRNFTETIELQIGLKNYDPQKDKRFSGSVKLPHIPRPKMKICMLGDAQHVEECLNLADVVDLGDKNWFGIHGCRGSKEVEQKQKIGEEACKEVSCFLSLRSCYQADSPSVGTWSEQSRQVVLLIGGSKFPTLVSHQESLESKVNETKATVKFQLKKVLCMGVAVGNLSMEEKQIFQNVQMSVNFLVSLLKKNWQNVRCLYLKSTMGKPQRIF